jgi:hypothetical protein
MSVLESHAKRRGIYADAGLRDTHALGAINDTIDGYVEKYIEIKIP